MIAAGDEVGMATGGREEVTTAGLEALAGELDGEVHGDRLHRALVAQDASPYRVLPAGVVYPRHTDDCRRLVAFARRQGLSVIPRGGGTSLAGQCVGRGIVVDTARHMTAIEAIDPEAGRVRAQPGVTVSQLNRALAPHGLVFGPDPSTASRATVGGIVGNNAWGPHALVDGSTRDQLVCATGVLADASLGVLGGEVGDAADAARRRELAELRERYRQALEHNAGARAAGVCDNNGYALHAVDAAAPSEAPVLAGAEGTLALLTSLELRVRPPLAAPRLLCPHFRRLTEAAAAAGAARAAGARAVELLDAGVLAQTRGHPEHAANRFWLEGEPAAVLLVELDAERSSEALAERLRQCGAGAMPVLTGDSVDRAWRLRRAGLGLLMGAGGPRKAVSGLEDTAVPVACLPHYLGEIEALMAGEGVAWIAYGPVGLGLVHVRPFLDFGRTADRACFTRLMTGLAALVHRYGGVWSSKHGDGRLRAPWLEGLFGGDWIAAMRAVKQVYDPAGVFNPGKILAPAPPLADLRGNGASGGTGPTGFRWTGEGGPAGAAARCHGAGACRQASVDGGMCPTYQATLDELHGTRGRANLFQQAFEAADPAAALAGDALHRGLSLCLGCKACQHECPAQVDMARLKAEHLYQRYQGRRMPLSARLAASFAPLSAAAARAPRLANWAGDRRLIQRAMGLSCAPPALARRSLPDWLRRRPTPGARAAHPVILLLDPHVAYYEPQVGRAAIRSLEAMGYSVHVTRCVTTGRGAISQGALDRARRELDDAVAAVADAGPSDAPVVGLEPSELLTLRDEAVDLVARDRRGAATEVAGRALLFEELLSGPARPALAHRAAGDGEGVRVGLHVHCHARALAGGEAIRDALATLPGHRVQLLTRGCCGMAGAFGYGRDTAVVSRAVAELELAPAVRALPGDARVVANGVSCRQQIARMTGRQARHPAERVAAALGVAA